MKYFVRTLLSTAAATMSFGVVFLANFGMCFGNYSSAYCNSDGVAISTFLVPILTFIAVWLLVSRSQRDAGPRELNGAPDMLITRDPALDIQKRVGQQSKLILWSYIALGVAVVKQVILLSMFDNYQSTAYISITRIPSPVLIALILAIIALLKTQNNRRNVFLASAVVVIGVVFGFMTFGRF